jgi:hypothetical protein
MSVRRNAGATGALLLLLAATLPAAPCPLPAPQAGEQRLSHGDMHLAWKTEPERITVGRPFVVFIQACPAALLLLRVDATMPEHRHGMNYRPSVKALDAGRWRAEGLLWHMAGRWELAFEVENGGERMWLRQTVQLP